MMYSSTRRELNQLAENHQASQLADQHAQAGKTIPALDRPPSSLMQILAWLDDERIMPAGRPYPIQERFEAARALPSDTTLRETLEFLGADPAALAGLRAEQVGDW